MILGLAGLALLFSSTNIKGSTAFVAKSKVKGRSLKERRRCCVLNSFSYDPGNNFNVNNEEAGARDASEIFQDQPSSPGVDWAIQPVAKENQPGPGAGVVKPVTVQGESLRTWSFMSAAIDRVQVVLTTEGRPLNANVDLWQGPDNTPQKMTVYLEDGRMRPFNCILETPFDQNTVAIRNTASMEYPLSAQVEACQNCGPDIDRLTDDSLRIVQGGSIKTYSFGASVGSISILIKTDGRPLNSRIELLQGPNTNKQVIDLYTEDGMIRPFYAIIETPGMGNVVRCINTAPMEFPILLAIQPYSVEPGYEEQIVSNGSWSMTNDATFYFNGGA